ncbi:MAG: FAD-dependent oxidoreductase [Dactylosporangium sp.]|nr:NAD(P)/FAD-dependent oxidoreductase [Dactylosporangium sp.]NNJ60037.1 FAD-dependent oxidoreductase [Dactylosporangium sp.]
MPSHKATTGLLGRRSGRIVVAGGGPAAVAAVEELRALGFAGEVTVLCGESTGPYDRTACSKGLIDGAQRPSDALLAMPGGARWQLGERAVELDPDDRVVTGSSGDHYPYDGLVIATGTTTSTPEMWPADEAGVYQLRSLNDAGAVRAALRGAGRVAIVGGGLTGCELACAVTQTGRSAVVVDPHRALLQATLGERFAALVTNEHRDAGIDLVLGRSVCDLGRRRGRFRLRLSGATGKRYGLEHVDADIVVLATGQRPDTDWLAGTGFDTLDGVLCDEALRVVGGDGTVVAAGAVARWPNRWHGEEPDRCGHWIAAMEQGAAAARTLMAGEDPAIPCTVMPRFASYQGWLRIQAAGRLDLADDIRLARVRPGRHSPARSGVVATYHWEGRSIGVAAVNAPVQFSAAYRTLLAQVDEPLPSLCHPAGKTDPTRSVAPGALGEPGDADPAAGLREPVLSLAVH